MLLDLVTWTAESNMPSWRDKKDWDNERRQDLYEWNRSFGGILARAIAFVPLEMARNTLIKPFLAEDEEALAVLARFADTVVRSHIFDATTIPANAISLLEDCVTRVLGDRTFDPNSYRAGQVSGHSMPELIDALMFVNVKKDCPGSTRFANGDWSPIAIIMPIIDSMVRNIGWASYVMGKFLTLCERA